MEEGLQIAKRSPSASAENRGEGVILTVDLPFNTKPSDISPAILLLINLKRLGIFQMRVTMLLDTCRIEGKCLGKLTFVGRSWFWNTSTPSAAFQTLSFQGNGEIDKTG